MSKCVIRPIHYSDVLGAPNAHELIAEYAAECSIPAIGGINPQPQIYKALEEAGIFQVFGAYAGEKLVGFASVLTSTLPHYGKKVATMESLFASKDHRSGGLGTLLLSHVENYAQASGCPAIFYSALIGSRLEKLLSLRSSCIRASAMFYRRLD